ncbi:alpha/beta fold hydrolase [Halomonas sp. 328]|uniref:alpha/beta fold hydrolase n=1 Tax=Halomonas sp. 328 TaxID=2776704 RepID=UPI0018A789C7|nr:alpha/beta fold hydrolase [Halomonas sp. 328]MBF8221575.1 alpha/beta fold hydrolase [Halomonas sp. 328]
MAIELHTLDGGEGDGLPLVVIHGLLGSADNWRSHLKSWQQGRRVVAVDLRNHGRSPHADGMRYGEMAADVLATLDRLGIERCHLLGHSMGGKVAITLARRHPERVASLVVADIAPVAYGHGHDAIFAALRAVEAAAPENRREVDAIMAEHVPERAVRLFLATNLVRGEGAMAWRVGLDEIEADYEAIRGEPEGEAPFQGPTLVIRGSRSNYVTDAMLPALREVLPEAQLATLEAGHWLHAEQPEAFQEAVATFAARVDGAGD